jgi:hypothetical protein
VEEVLQRYMTPLFPRRSARLLTGLSVSALLATGLAFARVEPTTHTFTAGEQTKVQGVIVARDGDMLKIRTADDSMGVIDLTKETKIQLRKSFGRKTAMDSGALVPGLNVEAQGKGNEKGELVAQRITFDPNSMRASRQIDTRVSPLEARTGNLEGRTGLGRSRWSDRESTGPVGRPGETNTAASGTSQS